MPNHKRAPGNRSRRCAGRPKVRWHFHERNIRIYFGGGMPPEEKGLAVQIGIPWGPVPEGADCYRIHPNRIEPTPDLFEMAALVQLPQRPLAARILNRIQERISGRKSWFYLLIRTAYHQAVILDPSEAKNAPPMRKGNEYLLNAKVDSHELVRLLTPIIEHHPSPQECTII
jgi:hypothetical protein